jgi:hypothetical protein
MVTDYDATVNALARLAGLRVLEFSDAENIGRRGGMTWIGDNSIEVAQPIVEGHAAQRFLSRFGPGMHSYALQVANLDATIAHLGAGGVNVGVRPAQGFCFTDPRTTGGLLFEWSDFTVDEDPRLGAVLPPHAIQPLLEVQTHAFVGAVVPEPLAWAETFGPLFGLKETFRQVGLGPGEPTVGLAAPDCTLALFAPPGDQSMALWGREHSRARMHLLGLGVRDLDEAASILSDAAIGVLRRTNSTIFVDPVATGGVPVALVNALLPGDPRR